MELFSTSKKPIPLDMPDAEVWYYPRFFDPETATRLFDELRTTIDWKQDDITVFGKTYPQPRLTALYGNNEKGYTYSNVVMTPSPFSESLRHIHKKIEKTTGLTFTTCLLNLYRDGEDSNGWHADNEKELGIHPIIASVSFGTSRWFHFKHRNNKSLKVKILLEPGSLLLMKGSTQEFWLHQLPKTKKVTTPRINLTFRTINS